MTETNFTEKFDGLNEQISKLESRVSTLEKKLIAGTHSELSMTVNERNASQEEEPEDLFNFKSSLLEANIGEFGLAWLGNIVLFFGITFLVLYLQQSGFKIIAPLLGFASVAGVFLYSHFLKKSHPHMARIFSLNGYLLLFIVTLKLHFYTQDPIITSKVIGLTILLLVTSFMMYLSVLKKYATLAGITIILIAFTALLSDSTHVMLSLAVLIAGASTLFLYRFGWIRIEFLSIIMVNAIILLWMFNNPLMGHQLQIVSTHQFGYLYIYSIAAIFSLLALMPAREESYSSFGIIGAIILNGISFVFLISIFVFAFYRTNYILPSGLIAFYCIFYSFILKVRSDWKITAALYALSGFVALSICIYAYYDLPRAFLFLAFQSLLVVSMAIWFRSKFIIIMNSLLYLFILLIYLTAYEHGNWMNISFSFVALATARILNWKREQLTIKSDLIRNFYLITAFLMVLYTLYQLVSDQYIALSWTIAAAVYFVLSIILKNVKYRYIALGTMISAAFYLFIVDLARIELIYRVIAMLFLALISIVLSFYYTKNLRKKVM